MASASCAVKIPFQLIQHLKLLIFRCSHQGHQGGLSLPYSTLPGGVSLMKMEYASFPDILQQSGEPG